MIIWRISGASFQGASIRYRSVFPAYYLKKHHQVDSMFLAGNVCPRHIPKNITALIIVKTLRPDDHLLMQKTISCNGKVIYDQCDNLFSKGQNVTDKFNNQMESIAPFINTIVTPTQALAETFLKQGYGNIGLSVIPDIAITKTQEYCAIKEQEKYVKTIRGLFKRPRYGWVDEVPTLQNNVPNVDNNKLKNLVWFGAANSKFGRTGLDLFKELIPDLNKVYSLCPFRLTIITNNFDAFEKIANDKNTKFPLKYITWSMRSTHTSLESANAVLLPVSNDYFGHSKSNNRATLALSAGVPVITNEHPSYNLLKTGLFLLENYESWTDTIVAALSNHKIRQEKLQLSKTIIEKDYNGEAIAGQWNTLLSC